MCSPAPSPASAVLSWSRCSRCNSESTQVRTGRTSRLRPNGAARALVHTGGGSPQLYYHDCSGSTIIMIRDISIQFLARVSVPP